MPRMHVQVCIEYLLRHKFEYADIRLLRDDGRGGAKPTRANILRHIDWLVGDARAGDSLFFHFSGATLLAPFWFSSCSSSSADYAACAAAPMCQYCTATDRHPLGRRSWLCNTRCIALSVRPCICVAFGAVKLTETRVPNVPISMPSGVQSGRGAGHGSQKRDYTGDERDGLNETICPTDFMRAGQIIDDTLNERLVRRVPKGCILHALLDACHSGTGACCCIAAWAVSAALCEARRQSGLLVKPDDCCQGCDKSWASVQHSR